jgi:hypothetical protein
VTASFTPVHRCIKTTIRTDTRIDFKKEENEENINNVSMRKVLLKTAVTSIIKFNTFFRSHPHC